MFLKDLLAVLPSTPMGIVGEIEVSGITEDSRQVKPGFLFVAVPGVSVDGHRFIEAALTSGAVCVVGQQPVESLPIPPGFPYVEVPDSRIALGWLNAAWRDFPSRKMIMVGITGTDGKTTTTNLLYQMLTAAEFKTGMISTVNARIGDQDYDTGLHTTTPPAPDVQRYLAQMVAANVTHAVLETTSHGLAQQRLAGCGFDVAVVTNITHEHLDYHGTWEAYRDAKAMLFRALAKSQAKEEQPKIAILNRDDELSYAALKDIRADWQISYGIEHDDADLTAHNVQFLPEGIRFMLHSPWGNAEICSSLVGAYNVSNILAAASAALALGVSPELVAQAVLAFRGVPGRMERIDMGQTFTAIVDFAHTPNALRRTLETARQMVSDSGRVIAVFGSAGLRDKAKRRMMGEVAGELADLTVLTAEDPRTESLDVILAESAAGVEQYGRQEGVDFWRVPDRGAAIRYAVKLARPGDIVLACGKGHEQSMCFGDIEYPWDDREAMRYALRGETLDVLPTAIA
ncbi:MAG: UDP-N-acetylmuramoyl-L-alanyl-D-glutamate--2,6-diaminopimelate ligase [Anaerolineae bacterium]|nr:UDP-N-acetylmuramoyl-L-alanyl-D-glutamate--2,6-diaminopimelate ligase [Anaerolineae bacterium]